MRVIDNRGLVYESVDYSPYLYHHGILGQKWGKRHGPPYPLEYSDYSREEKAASKVQKKANKLANKGLRDTKYTEEHTVPRGTKIYRTSVNPNESLNGMKYVSYLDADRNHYKGGWIRRTAGTDKAYEYEYTLTDDIKVPSRQTLYETVDDILYKNPKLIKETVDKHIEMTIPPNTWERAELIADLMDEEQINKGNSKATKKQVWENYCKERLKNFKGMSLNQAAFMASQTFGVNDSLKKAVINELKKKGYNAMVDEASVGGQNGWGREGVDPLIVFDGNMLKENNVRAISKDEESKSYSKDYDLMRKRKSINAKGWDSEISGQRKMQLAKMYKNRGMTYAEIAKKLGIPETSVGYYLNAVTIA